MRNVDNIEIIIIANKHVVEVNEWDKVEKYELFGVKSGRSDIWDYIIENESAIRAFNLAKGLGGLFCVESNGYNGEPILKAFGTMDINFLRRAVKAYAATYRGDLFEGEVKAICEWVKVTEIKKWAFYFNASDARNIPHTEDYKILPDENNFIKEFLKIGKEVVEDWENSK